MIHCVLEKRVKWVVFLLVISFGLLIIPNVYAATTETICTGDDDKCGEAYVPRVDYDDIKSIADGNEDCSGGVCKYTYEIKSNKCKLGSLTSKYNINMGITGGPDASGRYTIGLSLNPTGNQKARLAGVKFDIISINGKSVDNYKKVLTANGNNYTFYSVADNGYISVKLRISEGSEDPDCGNLVFLSSNISAGHAINTSAFASGYVAPVNEPVRTTNNAVDCSHPNGTFESEFCKAKQNAKNSTKDFTSSSPSLEKFKCNPNQFLEASELKGEAYYTNKQYLYGFKTITKGVTYTYHYSPSNVEKVNSSCKIKCEEGVTVEYGPPIASKAGLCFEYKVRVTSRVVCSTESQLQPPKQDANVCTPYPVCVGVNSGAIYKEAGPNDEFDSCVKSCDGGKYSKKCSEKCYKKVYGNSKSIKTNALPLSYNSSKTNLSDGRNSGGYYDWSGNSIKWVGPAGSPGRYYSQGGIWDCNGPQTSRGSVSRSGYSVTCTYYHPVAKETWFNVLFTVPLNDGFYRAHRSFYKDGWCHDSCSWHGCSKGQYLNYGMAEEDNTNNHNEYVKAKNICEAAASCSESTAEFSISVDYTDGRKTSHTISFPYQSGKDKLSSRGAKTKSNTSTNQNSTILLEGNDKYDGCYASSGREDYYRAAWSFPGSWTNLKTGEVTYKEVTGSGWRSNDKKFCMPLDARSVNKTWWNTFYGKKLGTASSYSINRPENKTKCLGGESASGWSNKTFSESDLIYNIHAATSKFGYIGWNINVDCFYALNNSFGSSDNNSNPPVDSECKTTDECEGKDCNPGGKGGSVNARVRSVNLEDMFPSEDGSKRSSSSSTGRAQGFNWTEYAKIDSNKNASYTSDPKAYLEEVQRLGYSVYSDDYLDYEFNLTPEDLRKLRKQTKSSNANYTSYNGTFTTGKNSGVSRYRSNVIRSIGDAKYSSDADTLDCNNMVNYHTKGCAN